jgi:hypothetical protein
MASREIRNTIYALKKDYGKPATLYTESFTVDISTGLKNRSVTDYQVKKAILLPTDWKRKFAYDLSFVAANKNFTYGGFFDTGDKLVLIDVIDIPVGLEITLDFKLTVGTLRYLVIKAELVDDTGLWALACRTLRGEAAGRVIRVNVHDSVTPTEESNGSTE